MGERGGLITLQASKTAKEIGTEEAEKQGTHIKHTWYTTMLDGMLQAAQPAYSSLCIIAISRYKRGHQYHGGWWAVVAVNRMSDAKMPAFPSKTNKPRGRRERAKLSWTVSGRRDEKSEQPRVMTLVVISVGKYEGAMRIQARKCPGDARCEMPAIARTMGSGAPGAMSGPASSVQR